MKYAYLVNRKITESFGGSEEALMKRHWSKVKFVTSPFVWLSRVFTYSIGARARAKESKIRDDIRALQGSAGNSDTIP